MKFHELRLAAPIVRAVAAKGYTTPTPIQAQAIPEALAGRDVLGCAQTGTGKTCAFALPILHRLGASSIDPDRPYRQGKRGRAPRALILCPTRELAMQIFESFTDYGRNLPLRHTVVYGGVNQSRQVRAMREGIDVLVATPGRLLDLINQGFIDLRSIETLVLDEADRMLDMGFLPDIRKVINMVPKQRQTLFFSATVSQDIRRLAGSILQDPVCLETTPESTTVELITQRVYMVERRNKPQLLHNILNQEDVERTLVFTRTKYGADKLVKFLRQCGVHADAIHGNKSQNARTRAMQGFKSGSTRVLVATDIASRGIDVNEISHVVNFDMPVDAETYVHRVGRTARAGASGIAISLCDRDEVGVLRAIERRSQIKLDVATDNTELTFKAKKSSLYDHPAQRQSRRPSTGAPRPKRSRTSNSRADRAATSGESRKSRSGGRYRKSNATSSHRGQSTSRRSGKPKTASRSRRSR